MESQPEANDVAQPRRPAWRSGSGVVAACALLMGAYHLVQWQTGVPGCDSGTTTEAIRSMFSPRIGSPLYGIEGAAIKLGDITEIGYVPARRQRACSATLVLEGESFPYTYIVGPLAGQDGKMGITGAQRGIVEARFGNVGEDGDFANQAAPIGRAQLEAALRAGVNAMPGLHAPASPDPDTAVRNIFNRVSAERTREIADIEPIGTCRAVQAGMRYTCRVMVERNDPLFASVGMGAEILDAEFTFERQGTNAPWRVAGDFSQTFAQALDQARKATPARKNSG